MTSLPSASRLERAVKCSASNVLPVVEREGGAAQEQGRVVHAYLESVTNVGQVAALAMVPEDYRELCAAIDLASLPVGAESYAAEVAFAFDYSTGKARELGRGIGRDYSGALPTEFVGTADVVGLLGDAVWVGDFKPRWSPNVTPAARNMQLRFLALAACRTYGRSTAHVELIHVGPDGSWHDKATLDAFDLDSFQAELFTLAQDIEGARAVGDAFAAPATEGAWCKFCPSFSYCPAKARLALQLGVAPDTVVHVTPETAGAAWARLKAARQVLDRVEEVLEQFAREMPFTTPDGVTVQATERRMEKIDGAAARPVLERLGIAAGEWSVTKTAITKAAGKGKADEVFEALRKAGAVKVTLTNPIMERRS